MTKKKSRRGGLGMEREVRQRQMEADRVSKFPREVSLKVGSGEDMNALMDIIESAAGEGSFSEIRYKLSGSKRFKKF